MKIYGWECVIVLFIITASCVLPKGNTDITQLIVCENNSTDLNCSSGYIDIVFASYGRHDKTTCPYKTISDTNCHYESSLEKVVNKCSNKTSCRVVASNKEFGDPCLNTFKYLNITYECVIDVFTTAVNNVETDTEDRAWIIVIVIVLFTVIVTIVILVLIWKRRKFGNCFKIIKKKQEQKSFHNAAYDNERRGDPIQTDNSRPVPNTHVYYNETGSAQPDIRNNDIINDEQNQYDLAKSDLDEKLYNDSSYSYPLVNSGLAFEESKPKRNNDMVYELQSPFPKEIIRGGTEQSEYVEAKFGQYDYLGRTDLRKDTSGKQYNLYSHTIPGNEILKDTTYDKAGENIQSDIDPCNTYSHTKVS